MNDNIFVNLLRSCYVFDINQRTGKFIHFNSAFSINAIYKDLHYIVDEFDLHISKYDPVTSTFKEIETKHFPHIEIFEDIEYINVRDNIIIIDTHDSTIILNSELTCLHTFPFIYDNAYVCDDNLIFIKQSLVYFYQLPYPLIN